MVQPCSVLLLSNEMDESQKHATWKTPENKGYILSVHLHKILEKAKSMTKQIDGCQELGVCVRGMGVDGKGQEEGQKWSTSWFSQWFTQLCTFAKIHQIALLKQYIIVYKWHLNKYAFRKRNIVEVINKMRFKKKKDWT